MRRVIVRYKLKPGQAAVNEKLVRAVYDELHGDLPEGFRYATFKLDDGVSFAHVASIEGADGHNPLPGLSSFKEFQAGIAARCEEPPVVTEIEVIGSYRFFDDGDVDTGVR